MSSASSWPAGDFNDDGFADLAAAAPARGRRDGPAGWCGECAARLGRRADQYRGPVFPEQPRGAGHRRNLRPGSAGWVVF